MTDSLYVIWISSSLKNRKTDIEMTWTGYWFLVYKENAN